MKKGSYLLNLGLAAVALIGFISFSASAQTQCAPAYNRNVSYNNSAYQNIQQIALTNGYQLGYGSGSNDRLYRASFDFDRNKTFRDADSGYRSQYGSKDLYREYFRQGYELGYRDGYSGYQRRTFQGYNDYNYNNYNNGYGYQNRYNYNRRRY